MNSIFLPGPVRHAMSTCLCPGLHEPSVCLWLRKLRRSCPPPDRGFSTRPWRPNGALEATPLCGPLAGWRGTAEQEEQGREQVVGAWGRTSEWFARWAAATGATAFPPTLPPWPMGGIRGLQKLRGILEIIALLRSYRIWLARRRLERSSQKLLGVYCNESIFSICYQYKNTSIFSKIKHYIHVAMNN